MPLGWYVSPPRAAKPWAQIFQRSLGVHQIILVRKILFPPPEKGPKSGKTLQIGRKSSRLTLFRGGGGRNVILWTTLFYGHLGVSEKGSSVSRVAKFKG